MRVRLRKFPIEPLAEAQPVQARELGGIHRAFLPRRYVRIRVFPDLAEHARRARELRGARRIRRARPEAFLQLARRPEDELVRPLVDAKPSEKPELLEQRARARALLRRRDVRGAQRERQPFPRFGLRVPPEAAGLLENDRAEGPQLVSGGKTADPPAHDHEGNLLDRKARVTASRGDESRLVPERLVRSEKLVAAERARVREVRQLPHRKQTPGARGNLFRQARCAPLAWSGTGAERQPQREHRRPGTEKAEPQEVPSREAELRFSQAWDLGSAPSP